MIYFLFFVVVDIKAMALHEVVHIQFHKESFVVYLLYFFSVV